MFKYCNANGISIAYQDRGAGEPLLLLMGLGASSLKWEPHMAVYEKFFRVIAPDNRGSGKSDKPKLETYTIREMAQDALAVLDAAGIESAHINGISMGGAIAQYIAIHYPQRVRSVVLTNTFPRCSNSFRRSIQFLRDLRGSIDDSLFGSILTWIIYSSAFQERNDAYIQKATIQDPDSENPVPVYAFKAQCNGILGFDATKELHKIAAPVLIASGDLDQFAPVWLTREMAEAIPDVEEYVCHDGGHAQHWEQLEAYNAITLSFLLRHSRVKDDR